jgi:hypothetical protein
LEQNVLRIQQQIQQLAKTQGRIDLSQISSNLGSTADRESSGDSVKLTLDGYEGGVASLESFPTPLSSFTRLENQGDPFLGAKANVISVGIESSAVTSVATQSRLSSKKVEVTPKIDVRGIPLSQFTVFAFGTSLNIDSANFAGSIGRIYAQNEVRLDGSFFTNYPVVSGGNVYTSGPLSILLGGNMPVHFSGEQTAYAQPSDSIQAAWLAEARTQYNSAIINSGSLPLSLSLAPKGNGSAPPTSANENSGLDFAIIRTRCDLFIFVQAGRRGKYGIAVIRGDPSWLEADGQPERVAATVSSYSIAKGRSSSGKSSSTETGWQNNPFVAKKVKTSGNDGQVVVSFNYGALRQDARQRIHMIFFEFDRSISDAAVLVRGAGFLENSLSIASRWPILIAGNFNSGRNPVPASILTTRYVKSVDPAWANTEFGSAP